MSNKSANLFFQKLKSITDWDLDFNVIYNFIEANKSQTPLNYLLEIFPQKKSFLSQVGVGTKYSEQLLGLLEFGAIVSKVRDNQLSVQDSFQKSLSVLNEILEKCLVNRDQNLKEIFQKSQSVVFDNQKKSESVKGLEEKIIKEYEQAGIPFQPLGLSNSFLQCSLHFAEFIPTVVAAAKGHSKVTEEDLIRTNNIFEEILCLEESKAASPW